MHSSTLLQGLLGQTFFQMTTNSSIASSQAKPNVLRCLSAGNVPYATADSPNWTALSTPFNLRLQYDPAVITIPETEDQVSKSIVCAAAAGLKVQPKGGGHSYASHSTGGQHGSLVIQMEKFSDITVDQTTFIAKIGAGQRLGNVAEALYKQGKRALPHGTCPGVGVAGHVLHGGYGYASRKWGLALDHIVALDVVLANGSQVHTTETTYPDVFWSMKGAGESFGVATYMYFQTMQAPDSVVYFLSDLAAQMHNTSAADAVDALARGFEVLQEFSLTSPLLTPNNTFGTYVDSNGTFVLRGWCMDCNASIFASTVLPEMVAGYPGHIDNVTELGWIEALTELADPDPLAQALGSGYTLHDTFHVKSLVTKDDIPLSTGVMKAYFSEVLANQGKGQFFSIINIYGGPGSAINTTPANGSAYSGRDSFWVIQNYGRTANGELPWDADITGIVDVLTNVMFLAQPEGKFTAYVNYVDPDLSAQRAAREYYGAATYNRLLALKRVLDPDFVFWHPQAVGMAVEFYNDLD
ncbi:Berberine bridge enzyme-like [Lachnellula subtilissima]|uniref:Berberine bridge enzyme-like n=1 Tax=Lachnellula subtilissima TaxID=602034 RepID=A0A8H8RRR9_9HELO|nr:Berberine bridge enzyme-like [Lachnellula subtilissima]